MWNKIKFWLGLKCVVQMGDKWVITHREFWVVRSVLDSTGYSWPFGSDEFRNNFKYYRSREEAEEALKLMKSRLRMKP